MHRRDIERPRINHYCDIKLFSIIHTNVYLCTQKERERERERERETALAKHRVCNEWIVLSWQEIDTTDTSRREWDFVLFFFFFPQLDLSVCDGRQSRSSRIAVIAPKRTRVLLSPAFSSPDGVHRNPRARRDARSADCEGNRPPWLVEKSTEEGKLNIDYRVREQRLFFYLFSHSSQLEWAMKADRKLFAIVSYLSKCQRIYMLSVTTVSGPICLKVVLYQSTWYVTAGRWEAQSMTHDRAVFQQPRSSRNNLDQKSSFPKRSWDLRRNGNWLQLAVAIEEGILFSPPLSVDWFPSSFRKYEIFG